MDIATRLKILVIDDYQPEAEMIRDYIKLKKHEVYIAIDLKKALDYCIEHNKAEKPFDLIFIDYRMPKNDGIEIAKEIKAVVNNAILTAITSYDNIDTIKMLCASDIFNHIMSKNKVLANMDAFLEMALSTKIQKIRTKSA